GPRRKRKLGTRRLLRWTPGWRVSDSVDARAPPRRETHASTDVRRAPHLACDLQFSPVMMRDTFEVSATQAAVASAALVGESAAAHVMRRSIAALAPTGAHVLFTGETGSGRRVWAE